MKPKGSPPAHRFVFACSLVVVGQWDGQPITGQHCPGVACEKQRATCISAQLRRAEPLPVPLAWLLAQPGPEERTAVGHVDHACADEGYDHSGAHQSEVLVATEVAELLVCDSRDPCEGCTHNSQR